MSPSKFSNPEQKENVIDAFSSLSGRYQSLGKTMADWDTKTFRFGYKRLQV